MTENIGNDPKGTGGIDRAATGGLLSAEDSLSYRLGEIERHLHNTEKWLGVALVPDGEDHVADRMNIANLPFTLVAGANDFGAWVQILGPDDTPVTPGMVKFDAHRILVDDTNSTNPFILQVVSGEFAGIAAKIAAEQYSETPYVSATNSNDSGIEEIMVRRAAVGEKVWARCRNIGGSGSTLTFFFGIHEYEG